MKKKKQSQTRKNRSFFPPPFSPLVNCYWFSWSIYYPNKNLSETPVIGDTADVSIHTPDVSIKAPNVSIKALNVSLCAPNVSTYWYDNKWSKWSVCTIPSKVFRNPKKRSFLTPFRLSEITIVIQDNLY